MRTLLLVLTLLFCVQSFASKDSTRYGISYAGHLVYNNAIGLEGMWTLVDRSEKTFFKNIILQSGLSATLNFRTFQVPILLRTEVFRIGPVGFDLSEGTSLTLFSGSMGLASVVCAAIPVTMGDLRVQTEGCLLSSTFDFGSVGGGIYYAF